MRMPEHVHGGWTTVLCDSLEKVAFDRSPRPFDETTPLVAYRGQTVSFQVAVRAPVVPGGVGLDGVRVRVHTPASVTAEVSAVDLVPVAYPAPSDADENYLDTRPGLYPDLLRPLGHAVLESVSGQWRTLWIDLTIAADAARESAHVVVHVLAGDSRIGEHRVPLQIVPVTLPELGITNTHWFHCDGLAEFYGDDVFSEAHWRTIDAFLGAAARMSVNSILTPAWTPPLDTDVGASRTPTQLVGISDRGRGRYKFDMTALRRWLELCHRHGIHTIEIPHLFTQWGAHATPAIYVDTDGGREQRFGWHVPATDPGYRALLDQLIPALRRLLAKEWSLDRVIFHVSDEPSAQDAESYAAARAVVADLLEGLRVVDAISDFALYSDGLVPGPVVATDHAAPFLEAGVGDLWLYYCVAQFRAVSNRFIAMASPRNRVIGTQLFLTGAAGFLHWGFNFYNSQLSRRAINPFLDTCAGGGLPGGDAFIVYPGPGRKPMLSIRYRVFVEAMDDYRSMQLLRELAGEGLVRSIVDPDGSLTLMDYPAEAEHYRRVAARIAGEISGRL